MIGPGVAVLLVLSSAAAADPIKLKLAFFSSDRSMSYRAAVKPFVDAVNAEANGLFEIEVHHGGALGREIAQQPQVVLDGVADLAFIVPGYSPDRFPDNTVIELPGLYRDGREATRVYTRLVAEKALKGYRDFHVVGAYVTAPMTIHGRLPLASLDDLKGKRIRINNDSQAAALEKLGAVPVPMQITQIVNGISSGKIDAAAVSLSPLVDYGISRVTSYHYLLETSGAPLALVMNRARFESLPKAAQQIIRRYSGEWAANRFTEAYEAADHQALEQLRSEPKRKVVWPSNADAKRAQVAFHSVLDNFIAGSPRNQNLLKAVENEAGKLRAAQ
jgi:TRAP-type C4-dicarboxylate transport system substrate-binding protein